MFDIDETYNPFEQEMRQVEQMQTLFDSYVAERFEKLEELVNEQLSKKQD